MAKESLPPFAAEWMKQWKNAANELQEVRDRELAEMDSTTPSEREPNRLEMLSMQEASAHGMVIMQAWFSRQRILALQKETKK